MADSILSLLPPVLAIALVIVTKKVLPSLGAGIVVGALLLDQFDPLASLSRLYHIVAGLFVDEGALNTDKVFNLIFLLFLGMTASLVTVCGGSRAFGEWAVRRIRTRRGASLIPAVLGIIIFIDDYFNALVVGNVSRPVTDRHRLSRAKLAYLVDSTSAPVCVLMPVSSWGAYIISVLAGILAAHGVADIGSLEAFVRMVPMNYYAIVALVTIFCVALFKLDLGPMRTHENRAITTGMLTDPDKGAIAADEQQDAANPTGKIRDLITPIIVLVLTTVAAMVVTGSQGAESATGLLSIFENTDVPTSLLIGSFCGWLTVMGFVYRRKPDPTRVKRGLWAGIKSMLPAIWILLFAWTIIEVINDLGTGNYLAGLVNDQINLAFLPVLLFIISGFMAFSTGTSWGTFGVMLPIAGEIAAATDISLLLPVLASVLAGAIFGDHCSPISDTTILSSAGAQSHHIDHVVTQMPYAVSIAIISAVGYLVLGLTDSVLLGLGASLLLLALALIIVRITTRPPEPDTHAPDVPEPDRG